MSGRELRAAAGRRCLTIPLFVIAWLAVLVTLPVLLIATLALDVFARTGLSRSRCALMLVVYLSLEVWGILMAFGLWLAGSVWAGTNTARYLEWNRRLQNRWGQALFAAARKIFSLKVEVEGEVALAHGPMIVFIRHASIIDTLLPVNLISLEHGILLRYVLKHELLFDPCLDIVGNRLPNHFTKRQSGDHAHEIASVGSLARDLGPSEGVLIFPEGTRFSPAARERVIERLTRSGNPRFAERARNLKNLLPPRLGGVLALLDANDRADAVFMIHSGFEGALRAGDLWRGSLVRRSIRVRCWRVPFDEIPNETDRRTEWIFDQWKQADDWLARA